MTISTTTILNSYSGNGSTTAFAYTFPINTTSEISVIERSATGTETVKSEGTGSTNYGIADNGSAGGTVTMVTAPASGTTLLIRRNTDFTQETDYVANDPFPAETHEDALDKLQMQTQELEEELNRSLKISRTNSMTSTEFTTSASDRASKVLAFDSSGELSVTQELGTFKGNSATTTTAAFVKRDIIKATTTAQLNNIYICVADSVIGDTLTDTDHFELLVDAVSAATSATTATTKATAAASSATAAASSASTASTQASNASSSATAAASSATAAANSADAFDDVYLGTKSSDPSTDNDGDALAAGMLYFNTTTDLLRVYTGSAWQNAAVDTTGFVTVSGTQTLTNKTLTAPVIASIATVSNGALELAPNGTGTVVVKGNTNSGAIKFNCESNSHGQTLASQPHSASATNTMLLPQGANSTLVSLVSTDTLTNKTLTSPKINGSVAVTATGTELNYTDVATLGLSQASKAVTADVNGVITLDNGFSEEYEAVTSSSNAIAINLRTANNFSHTLTENTTISFANPAASGKVSAFTLKIIQASSAKSITWHSSIKWAGDTAPTLSTGNGNVDVFTGYTVDGGTNYYMFTAGQVMS